MIGHGFAPCLAGRSLGFPATFDPTDKGADVSLSG